MQLPVSYTSPTAANMTAPAVSIKPSSPASTLLSKRRSIFRRCRDSQSMSATVQNLIRWPWKHMLFSDLAWHFELGRSCSFPARGPGLHPAFRPNGWFVGADMCTRHLAKALRQCYVGGRDWIPTRARRLPGRLSSHVHGMLGQNMSSTDITSPRTRALHCPPAPCSCITE
jgi:hypothetical protein